MNANRYCYDEETGEIVSYGVNEETGEMVIENNVSSPIYVISKKMKKSQKGNVKYIEFPKGYMARTKAFQSLKEQILSGSNPMSYRIFLLPTLTLFPAYMCTLLILFEVFLHATCHINNRKLKDPALYYQSPFHLITRTFCGVCRDCDTASKIGQLQDQRRIRYDYFRSIAI